MSPKEILLSSISFLVLLSSSIYTFHELSKPVKNYDAITWVYGLETLKREDIVCKLYKEKLDGKPILLANPVRISNRLERHPLIAEAKVKRFIVPHHKIKIYIKETKLWAKYGSILLDQNAKSVVNLNRVNFNSRTQSQLRTAIAPLVIIESSTTLKDKDLVILRKLCKTIETSTKLKVTNIKGDREKNFVIYTNHYNFKIGLLDHTVVKRIQRVTLVLDQLRSIDKNHTDLEYIDLSLSSSQVILGRKQVIAAPVKKAIIDTKATAKQTKAVTVKALPKPSPKPAPKPLSEPAATASAN